jgi:Flp pilus assembly protein TadD
VGEAAAGLEVLSKLRQLFPKRIEGFLDAGAYLLEDGQIEAAHDILEVGLMWHVDNASLWCNVGRVAQERADIVGAETAFRQAIALDPSHKEAWSNLGVLQFEMGDLEGAKRSIEEAARLAPDDPAIAENLALVTRMR